MQIIPLQAVASQSIDVQLANQACTIEVFQSTYGLFINLSVSGALIIGGVIAENLNRIVRDAYLGFLGDLVFNDLQDSTDPVYTGLGTRYVLYYLATTDLPAGEG